MILLRRKLSTCLSRIEVDLDDFRRQPCLAAMPFRQPRLLYFEVDLTIVSGRSQPAHSRVPESSVTGLRSGFLRGLPYRPPAFFLTSLLRAYTCQDFGTKAKSGS